MMDEILATSLAVVGISPTAVKDYVLLRQKSGHSVYRLLCCQGSYVLKCFTQANAVEPQVYALLERLHVPVLPLYARTPQALLLEDLRDSPSWRLATDADMAQAVTGEAVAAWYQHLHRAGQACLTGSDCRPKFLRAWFDVITEESLAQTGRRFGLADVPGWVGILKALPLLKNKYRAFPQTLNYSDFAAENLALSVSSPYRAVVFDYDCFSTGPVYADWRNVASALRGAACRAFMDAYGPVDPQQARFDGPLASLEGLVVAAQRPQTPAWALPLVQSARDGSLWDAIMALV